ncbi:hypothetical protein KBI23_21570 [bacterium]|nr:hypothetical protein [bacterium]MBP9811464.1 hypothetical protein [bacterium]
MTPYIELKNALYREFERQLKELGFCTINKANPGVLERPLEDNFRLRATVLVDRIGEGIKCQFVVGLRCVEVYEHLDRQTVKLLGTGMKWSPVWAENLVHSAKTGTPLDEYIESPDDIPILVRVAVKVFEEQAFKKACSLANIQRLSNLILTGDGPGMVQFRFQPVVLAMAGRKVEAINWIKDHYLSDSKAEIDSQIGQSLLANPLFRLD